VRTLHAAVAAPILFRQVIRILKRAVFNMASCLVSPDLVDNSCLTLHDTLLAKSVKSLWLVSVDVLL
jgi:hypothetical protein